MPKAHPGVPSQASLPGNKTEDVERRRERRDVAPGLLGFHQDPSLSTALPLARLLSAILDVDG